MITENPSLSIALLNGYQILIGRHTLISFVRTLRIPEDGKSYPLPTGLGRLPIYRVSDYASKVPKRWLETGGFFIPLYQREALYLEFGGVEWRPTIVKVAVGSINAVTGKPYDARLRSHQQDYVVVPNQQWLDGINTEKGAVGQFVAMPLGMGYTVEEQITDEAKHGGFQLIAFDPKSGNFCEQSPISETRREDRYKSSHPPKRNTTLERETPFAESPCLLGTAQRVLRGSHLYAPRPAKMNEPVEMGIAAGGSIQQQIIVDPHGVDSWDVATATPIHIHIVNSLSFELITGQKSPPTPITAYSYRKRGFPWYSKYDENTPTVVAAKAFRAIKRVLQIDRARGVELGESAQPISIDSNLIKRIHIPTLDEHIADLCKRAEESFSKEEYDSTVRAATGVLDFVANDGNAFILRAHAYLRLGQHKQAEMDASSALDIEPKNVRALLIRGHANLSTGWPALAEEDAKAALQIAPDDEHARKLLATASQKKPHE
jgi:hypothetical protein